MSSEVRILLLEDEPKDVELINIELKRLGATPRLHHVTDRDGFVKALRRPLPDVILCDYKVPRFDGRMALQLAKEMVPEIPFIIVTGSINEETAVECMKAGAADYVLKDRLFQLVPAVHAALEARRRDAEKKQLEEARALLAAVVESSSDAIISKNLEGMILSWNKAAERIFGYSASEIAGQPISRLIPPDLQIQEAQFMEEIRRGGRIERVETVRITKDGRRLDVSVTLSPVKDSTGRIVGASTIARDISERKHAEQEREALIRELSDALANIQTLNGLLPICARCKKIRDDTGYWNQLEAYIRKHTNAKFTHGLCPECVQATISEFNHKQPDEAPKLAKP